MSQSDRWNFGLDFGGATAGVLAQWWSVSGGGLNVLGADQIAGLTSFLPGDTVTANVGGSVELDLEQAVTESFTDIYRFRVQAAKPVRPVASALPAWGFALLAGLFLGLSLRIRRGRRVVLD